jgi:hypothetical protein
MSRADCNAQRFLRSTPHLRGFSSGNPVFSGQIPNAIRAAAQMIATGEVVVPITATYPCTRSRPPSPTRCKTVKFSWRLTALLADAGVHPWSGTVAESRRHPKAALSPFLYPVLTQRSGA